MGTVCQHRTLCTRDFDASHYQIYSDLTFKISINFPANYPYVAPTIKFDTPCYHPNVDITGGAICLDILQVSLRTRNKDASPDPCVGQMVGGV